MSDSASSCFFPWNYSALNWLGHSVLLTAFISLSYSPHLLSSSMWDACRKLNLLSWSEDDAVEAHSHPYCAWRVLQCPSLLERHCSRPGLVCNGVGFFFLTLQFFLGSPWVIVDNKNKSILPWEALRPNASEWVSHHSDQAYCFLPGVCELFNLPV